MNLQSNNLQTKKNAKYDLEERTAKFAETVIDLMRKIPNDSVNKRMIEQVVGSAGSIGANYCEADDAESKKDFKHKIGIAKKEARETKHWLRMISTANPPSTEKARQLWQEAKELHLIFNAIVNSIKKIRI